MMDGAKPLSPEAVHAGNVAAASAVAATAHNHKSHEVLLTDAELISVIKDWRDGNGSTSDALLAQLILQNRGHR